MGGGGAEDAVSKIMDHSVLQASRKVLCVCVAGRQAHTHRLKSLI